VRFPGQPSTALSGARADRAGVVTLANIVTTGRHTVLEVTPALVGCIISAANHSFSMIRNGGECVINLPTTALTEAVVGIGNTTGPRSTKLPISA
jgi:flavin reductase (DIM6/NTAB) family NADH-FMN oxidoreductase RutF